jgi:hypothetical protein
LNVASRDFFVSPYALPPKHITHTRVIMTAGRLAANSLCTREYKGFLKLFILVSICESPGQRQYAAPYISYLIW